MDLYEYQAKELFARHGVPLLDGGLAASPEEARATAARLGVPVVIKAQVKTGGRGKAGGVRPAAGPETAQDVARQILGMDIKGHTAHTVLVEQAKVVRDEYYVAFLVDRSAGTFLAIASSEGGMDIEHVAEVTPEAIARLPIDPYDGLGRDAARRLAADAGYPEHVLDAAADVFVKLWSVVTEEDALLVEVNPLATTTDGELLALDGKVTLDDNARFRHDHDGFDELDVKALSGGGDSLEARARARHLNYVKLDGQVGVIGNGAGLVMSTLDVVALAGESHGGQKPANFLDIGGGASAQVMADGLEIILSDPDVRSVLVNVFGGITACDAVAHGILAALELLTTRGETPDRPIVVRLDGNNALEGRRILADAGHPLIQQIDTMDGAAEQAARLAAA